MKINFIQVTFNLMQNLLNKIIQIRLEQASQAIFLVCITKKNKLH